MNRFSDDWRNVETHFNLVFLAGFIFKVIMSRLCKLAISGETHFYLVIMQGYTVKSSNWLSPPSRPKYSSYTSWSIRSSSSIISIILIVVPHYCLPLQWFLFEAKFQAKLRQYLIFLWELYSSDVWLILIALESLVITRSSLDLMSLSPSPGSWSHWYNLHVLVLKEEEVLHHQIIIPSYCLTRWSVSMLKHNGAPTESQIMF